MVSDAQGEEYKPMQAGIHLYVEDCDAIYKRAMGAGTTSIIEPATSSMVIEVRIYIRLICTAY
jgi:uncharacterized glyoxalase superfamily protein PhnB